MPKPSQTNATSTAINPVQVAQQPYLNYGWGQAQDLYKNDPQTYYPGQTLADYIPPNTLQTQGYQDLYNTGQNVTPGHVADCQYRLPAGCERAIRRAKQPGLWRLRGAGERYLSGVAELPGPAERRDPGRQPVRPANRAVFQPDAAARRQCR